MGNSFVFFSIYWIWFWILPIYTYLHITCHCILISLSLFFRLSSFTLRSIHSGAFFSLFCFFFLSITCFLLTLLHSVLQSSILVFRLYGRKLFSIPQWLPAFFCALFKIFHFVMRLLYFQGFPQFFNLLILQFLSSCPVVFVTTEISIYKKLFQDLSYPNQTNSKM